MIYFFFFLVIIWSLEGEKHERIRGHPMYDPRGEIVLVLSIRSMLGDLIRIVRIGEKSMVKRR